MCKSLVLVPLSGEIRCIEWSFSNSSMFNPKRGSYGEMVFGVAERGMGLKPTEFLNFVQSETWKYFNVKRYKRPASMHV